MENTEIIKACKITNVILKKTLKELKKGSFETERDISRFLKRETYSNGCKLAFRPIVAMHENAAEIHHIPNNTKLKKGFLIIDFGVRYKGYCADCTRTFYIGKPSREERKLYDLVLESCLTASNHVCPGVYAADIDSIARGILEPYFRNFVHATGHGVGKRIHQAPTLRPSSKSVLKENQVVTIEPGLYFPNKLGIRIEDTMIVKENSVILTTLPKNLITI